MGVVYKAGDTHLDRYIALKIRPLVRPANPERRRRLVREAKARVALNHPNIINVQDIDHQDDIDFRVTEYAVGKTLDGAIPRRDAAS